MAASCSLKSLLCRRQPQVTSSLRSLANFTIPYCQSVKLARFKHLVWLETCFDLCRLHAFYPLSLSPYLIGFGRERQVPLRVRGCRADIARSRSKSHACRCC